MLYYINFICICIECNDFPLIYNLTIRLYNAIHGAMTQWRHNWFKKENDNGNHDDKNGNNDNDNDSQQ